MIGLKDRKEDRGEKLLWLFDYFIFGSLGWILIVVVKCEQDKVRIETDLGEACVRWSIIKAIKTTVTPNHHKKANVKHLQLD